MINFATDRPLSVTTFWKNKKRYGRIVIKLCLGVDVAKSEDEEFSVVDAVEFSPESLDFRVY